MTSPAETITEKSLIGSLRRVRLNATLCGGMCLCGLAVSGFAQPDQPATSTSQTPLATNSQPTDPESDPRAVVVDLLTQLGSPDFQRRNQAQDALRLLGGLALPELERQLPTLSLEVSVRVLQIFVELAAGDDTVIAIRAEEALERLSKGPVPSLANRAREALETSLQPKRRVRAIKRLQDLGATLIPVSTLEDDLRLNAKEIPLEELPIAAVVIGRRWKGGLEGLQLLAMLPELRSVQYTSLTKLDLTELQNFVSNQTKAQLEQRAPTYLGVRSDANAAASVVDHVVPGSPAEQGGIKAGDLFLFLNGRPVGTFQRFIQMMNDFEPGLGVELIVLRPRPGIRLAHLTLEDLPPGGRVPLEQLGEIVELEVTLGEW